MKNLKNISILAFLIWASLASAQTNMKQQSINQNWQFHQIGKTEWYPAQVPGCVQTDLLENKLIADPFIGTNEKDIQWIDKEDWEYKTEFDVTKEQLAFQNIEIGFDGLDTYADVYLNGEKIINASNMFRQWNADCKSLLENGKNELLVYFHSPIKVGIEKYKSVGYYIPVSGNDKSQFGGAGNNQVSIYERKPGYHFGWDLTPRIVTIGIWRPVVLKVWNQARIENVQYVQKEVNKKEAKLSAVFEINSNTAKVMSFEIYDSKANQLLAAKKTNVVKGINQISVDFVIKEPKLWWTNGLGEPYLYNLKSQIRLEKQILDIKTENIGIRTLNLIRKPDSAGHTFYIELNGVPVFMKGSNYVPNDQFPARVTTTQYENIISSAAEANMNMIRLWGGGFYENDLLYDLCDKNGILVWQDFMFACSLYPGDQEFLNNVKVEAEENIKRLRNHPSIAMWCGNNESEFFWIADTTKLQNLYKDQRIISELRKGYDDLFYGVLKNAVEKYDSQRLYWGSSPMAAPYVEQNEGSGDRHYWDVWFTNNDFTMYNEIKSRFFSEYGFVGFPEMKTIQRFTGLENPDYFSDEVSTHQKSPEGNLKIKNIIEDYYHFPLNMETSSYLSQLIQAEAVKTGIEAHRRNMPYCMGSLYWQLNDVWPGISWASIDYYGNWKGLHYFAKKAFSEQLLSIYNKDGKIQFYVVSDRLKPIKAEMTILLKNFKGKQLYSKTLSLDIPANSSRNFFEIGETELLKGLNKDEVVLNAFVTENGKEIASSNYYFDKPKNLKLTAVKPEMKISKKGNDFTIQLSSNELVKSVYLTTKHINGHFSDNFFDILPGQSVNVVFKPIESVGDIENDLNIFTINEWNNVSVAPPVIMSESGDILLGDSIFITINPDLQKRFDKIVYTTDGTIPTEKSEVYKSFIPVSKDFKLKCMILTTDGKKSEVVAASFVTKLELLPSAKTGSKMEPGISYKYYEGKWEMIPDFTKLNVIEKGTINSFDVDKAKITQYYGFEFDAWFYAFKDGVYTFWMSSDDGAKFFIDNKELINNDGCHGTVEKNFQVGLKKGFHKVYVPYFNALYAGNISINYRAPGKLKEKMDKNAMFKSEENK